MRNRANGRAWDRISHGSTRQIRSQQCVGTIRCREPSFSSSNAVRALMNSACASGDSDKISGRRSWTTDVFDRVAGSIANWQSRRPLGQSCEHLCVGVGIMVLLTRRCVKPSQVHRGSLRHSMEGVLIVTFRYFAVSLPFFVIRLAAAGRRVALQPLDCSGAESHPVAASPPSAPPKKVATSLLNRWAERRPLTSRRPE
jgi:hypothetical protein